VIANPGASIEVVGRLRERSPIVAGVLLDRELKNSPVKQVGQAGDVEPNVSGVQALGDEVPEVGRILGQGFGKDPLDTGFPAGQLVHGGFTVDDIFRIAERR